MFQFLRREKIDIVSIQNERILNESFPWLWRIKGFWFLPGLSMVVLYRDRTDALERLLEQSPGNWSGCEMWIYVVGVESCKGIFEIKQVTLEAGSKKSVAETILGCIPSRRSVRNIVTVVQHRHDEAPTLPNGARAQATIRIYEPAKGEESFNDWLLKLKKKWDERVPF